jgi:hypothetical protein
MPESHAGFLHLLSGDQREKGHEKAKPKHQLFRLIVWWAVYGWHVRAQAKQALYVLDLNADESVKDAPVSLDHWTKLIKAVLPDMRCAQWDQFFDKVPGQIQQDPPSTWRSLLEPHAAILSRASSFLFTQGVVSLTVILCLLVKAGLVAHGSLLFLN